MKNQITLPDQGKNSSGSSLTLQQGMRSNCHQKNSLFHLSVFSRGKGDHLDILHLFRRMFLSTIKTKFLSIQRKAAFAPFCI